MESILQVLFGGSFVSNYYKIFLEMVLNSSLWRLERKEGIYRIHFLKFYF